MKTPGAVMTTTAVLLALLVWSAGAVAEEAAKDSAQAAQPAQPAQAQPGAAAKECERKSMTTSQSIDEMMARAAAPFPWFKWGADFRLRDEHFINHITLNEERERSSVNQIRYRPRFWGTLTPVKDYDLNFRITWEGRKFHSQDGADDWAQGEATIDNLNVKLTNFLGTPLTITAGRQDIIFGDGWLILEGTPLDGSRTIFFDAVRLTYDLKQCNTTIDAIYIEQTHDSDRWIRHLEEDDLDVIEENERGAIFYVTNKSLKKTQIDGYYMWRRQMRRDIRTSRQGDLHTFGGRVAGDITDHWKYRFEGAHQFGHRDDRTVRAFGVNSRVTYMFNDRLKNQLRAEYEFLSGDDPDSPNRDEAFDLVWGRWPRWSELLVLTWAAEGGRPGQVTNLHRFVPIGWSCFPTPKMELCADYHLLFADENTFRNVQGFSDSGCFRGQLLVLLMKYTFNKHMKGHLMAEFFFPGGYQTDFRDDMATFLRGEIYFTW